MAADDVESNHVIQTQPKKQNRASKGFHNFVASYFYGGDDEDTADHAKRARYLERATCKPNCSSEDGGPPYMTVAIIIVSFYFYFTVNLQGDPELEHSRLVNSPYVFQPKKIVSPIDFRRFFTYSFLHANWLHISGNMIMLALVGPLLEGVHDSGRPFAIYVIGTVLGAMFSAFAYPKSALVGASGGCYALVAAHISDLIVNADLMRKTNFLIKLVLLIPLFSASAGEVISFYKFMVQNEGREGEVSFSAHTGGVITGVFLGMQVLRNYEPKRWEDLLRRVFFIVFQFIWCFLLWKTARCEELVYSDVVEKARVPK